jgi:alanine dehydrogenase
MPEGSVIIDISVDQGGCVETTRPTDYSDPVYIEEGVVHFAVTNIPGAVPRTASQALSAVILPYVSIIANDTWQSTPELSTGLNVSQGEYVHPAIRTALA